MSHPTFPISHLLFFFSHVSRTVYDKMVLSTKTAMLPPFISVDGYGLCCDFTEECTRAQVEKRKRSIRECIHKYGQCTGGQMYFFHGG